MAGDSDFEDAIDSGFSLHFIGAIQAAEICPQNKFSTIYYRVQTKTQSGLTALQKWTHKGNQEVT